MTDLYLDANAREMSLETLKRLMADRGAKRLFFKRLAPNDNSKNQIYLGGSPEDTRPLPTGDWRNVLSRSKKGGSPSARYILQAPVDLQWLRPDGAKIPASQTKLIMYPQYGARGEFRLSGFLQATAEKPSTLLDAYKRGREAGRVLLFGVGEGKEVLCWIASADSLIARELGAEAVIDTVGVFQEIELLIKAPVATRDELLLALGDVHRRSWVDSKLLHSTMGVRACNGPQCVGQTLLAELGVPADGRAAPDYRGWEVKAFTLRAFASRANAKISLMTPEPTGGFYFTHGLAAFIRKYGARSATFPQKIYFQGCHKLGVRNALRGTTMVVAGYDAAAGAIVDASGGIRLVDDTGAVAAEWGFAGLVEHWRRKHARAVFVPGLAIPGTPKRFRYADFVHLGEGNPFVQFMRALIDGTVVYDPGSRLDESGAPGTTVVKPRNQFRAAVPKALERLYTTADVRVPVR